MIYIDMGANRLGNQLFRYAFARLLQESNPDQQIIFNFDAVNRFHREANDGYENSLRFFHTRGTEKNDEIRYSIIQYMVLKLYRRFYPRNTDFCRRNRYERRWVGVLAFFGLYFLSLGYYPFRLKKPWWVSHLIVNGCFECEQYFKGIERLLKEEIVPLKHLDGENLEIMSRIRNSCSVAVCVRRGDFLNKYNAGTYAICDLSYFEKAIDLIKKRLPNPSFFFFSDDLTWVKENIKVTDSECYYELEGSEVWETFQLMYSCQHFIISNSTMHWWAQFLGSNQKKIVIAPSRWYNIDFKSDLYQENWTLIEV